MWCAITILLLISGDGSPKTENLRFYGDCLVRERDFEMHISPYSTDLHITQKNKKYIIVMPKKPGMYELQYSLGRNKAALLPGGEIPVRVGSRGFY